MGAFYFNGLLFLFFFMPQSIVFRGQHLCLVLYLDKRMHGVVIISPFFTILTDIVVAYCTLVSNSFNLLNLARLACYSAVDYSTLILFWLFEGLVEVFQININFLQGLCFELLNFSIDLSIQPILVILQLLIFLIDAPMMLEFSLKIESSRQSLFQHQFGLFDQLAFIEVSEFSRICNTYFVAMRTYIEESIVDSGQKLENSHQLLTKLFIVT